MAIGPVPWLGPLLMVSLWGSSAPASLLRRLGEHIQRFQESSGLGLSLDQGGVALPKEGWLEQPLDPFNASDRRSFLQRYWVNDQHWTSQDGPVFLHLGGEGSLGPGSVMRGHPATLAPVWGALVIGLEHRFYGLSIPAEGLDVAQLRFLSSRHALADVVSARLALSRLFNVSFSSPWLCFGGSYAGSLAAWARLKFPHLIFASVASSAPVRAILDFSEYNDCRAAASAAFAEVERRLRAGGSAQAALRAELGACGSLGRAADQAELLGALQALVGGAVQYDGQAGAPLKTVAQLKVTEPQVAGVGDRQWLYQTCTEFGYYVTCEVPECPFSQLPALPSKLELCEQVFGFSASSIAQAVSQTNSYYGGQTPGATQVLFVNGDIDPWHVLSITQPLGPSESALLIPSASHCLDMAPERPSDSPSLRLARQNIFQQLQTWLGLAKKSQVRDPPVSPDKLLKKRVQRLTIWRIGNEQTWGRCWNPVVLKGTEKRPSKGSSELS
ncbi:hypothetical protein J1605_004396 [Eschrichtius robustus]|uniref:Thymus-specific serine protease n=1 Tax=Eschrichtius robustus TaxID=9764 RepID=A0AB34HGT2_ESCRO|nr:hypothetical protein J1605_004396 [Eschrichtius robustus]